MGDLITVYRQWERRWWEQRRQILQWCPGQYKRQEITSKLDVLFFSCTDGLTVEQAVQRVCEVSGLRDIQTQLNTSLSNLQWSICYGQRWDWVLSRGAVQASVPPQFYPTALSHSTKFQLINVFEHIVEEAVLPLQGKDS